MKIEPCYVEFLQAKLLKEKGFKNYCKTSYWENILTFYTPGYALENGETSAENYNNFPRYYAPEQHEIIEWLRIVHGIWIHVCYLPENTCWAWDCYKYKEENGLLNEPALSFKMNLQSPQEAYSKAISYCLENII